jgi:hypothetical protein
MNTAFHSSIKFFIAALLLICLGSFALAHDAHNAAEGAIPEIVFTATAEGIDVPEELPFGLVKVVIDNQSEAPTMAIPARLLDDVTREDFFAAIEAGGPMAALALVSLQGGTLTMPGTSYTVTYDLAAGDYVVINFAGEMPDMYFFTVTEPAEAVEIEAPEADVELKLVDFSFVMPITLEAGEQVWKVDNQGGQWHEMALTRVDDAMTDTEIRALVSEMAAGAGPEGDPNLPQPNFLWAPMGSDEQAWFTLDLEPGKYVLTCFLPDMTSEEGHSHDQLGMVHIVTVE